MPSEQEVFEIRTFDDLVRALRLRPEWREELQRLILTNRLLELPDKFDAFVEQEFRPLQRDVAALKQDVKALKQDVAELKGRDLERHVREKAPAYFGRLLRRVRPISSEALAEMLEKAEEAGHITEEERLDALQVDVVVRGRLKTDGERALVVEVSQVVDVNDVKRAVRRAQIIAKAMGIPAIPMVLGKKMTQGARQAVEGGEVLSVIVQ